MASGALGRRLSRLEGRAAFAGRDGPCRECGYVKGAPTQWIVHPPKVIGEPDDPPPDTSNDICAACGRTRITRWVVRPPKELHQP